jgi:hypothetical protein
MKLAYRHLESVKQLPIQKRKSKTAQYALQLVMNLSALYVANEITVDIWRSLTGH